MRLAQAFGWRSMFAFLAALTGACILPLLLLGVPETLQYKVLQRLLRTQPEVVSRLKEAPEILGQVCHQQCRLQCRLQCHLQCRLQCHQRN